MFCAQMSVIIFCRSGDSLSQNTWLVIGMYSATNWRSCSEYLTPESHNFALTRLSFDDTSPSKVPCDSASGTFGHAVVLGMAPRKRARQAWPAPPELRIFMPLRSARLAIGLLEEYQFWKPRSRYGPITCERSFCWISALRNCPAFPSITLWISSIGWPYSAGSWKQSASETMPVMVQLPGAAISSWPWISALPTSRSG